MNTRGERSTPELFGDALSQLGKLIGKEFALARAEVAEKVSEAGRAVAFIGAGAILMIPACFASICRFGGVDQVGLHRPRGLSPGRRGHGRHFGNLDHSRRQPAVCQRSQAVHHT